MRRAAVLLALAALACGEDPPASTAPQPQAAKKIPTSSTSRAAPSASASASEPLPKFEIAEADLMESERSRDPFRSYVDTFVEESKGAARSQRQVVLSQFGIDELKLIGIVTRAEPARAMLVDPNGVGHVVQRGQFVGRADVIQATGRTGQSYEINWRVDRIRDGDVVLVREDPQNPDVPSATRVIELRPEGDTGDRR